MTNFKFKIGNTEVTTKQLNFENAYRYIFKYKKYWGMRGKIEYITAE